ncbi:MFS general substrate transporter [Lojkania enalia]|uniref:MFS general substrate transporter n=1 Tax=Lojkania enalia TaxID=147567 RepID=A0A9P4KFL5_9PLEO|nr:MFS general substrate transporter [Didymosphaeria enalia]
MDSIGSSPPSSQPDPHELPLRKAIRQYSKVMGYLFSMTTAVLLWGYDSVIVGSITAIPAFQRDFGKWDTSEDDWIIPAIWLSLWAALGPVGQVFGATFAGFLQDRLGRRINLFIGSVLAAISILVVFFAYKAPTLDGKRGLFLFGKTLQGVATAIIKIQTLTYVSENVPTCLRGLSMAFMPTFTLLGQLLGAIVIYVVSDIDNETSYLIALGSQWVLSIAPFILSFVMPESPAYLVRKKDMAGAHKSLTRLLAPKNDPDEALERLKISIEEEEKIAKHVSYRECFQGTNRRRTIIIIFANFLPPLFGLPLLSSSSYFLQQVGMEDSSSILFLIVGICLGLVANAISTWTLSHLPRRGLTIWTLVISAGLWAGMGISGFWHNNVTPWICGAFAMAVIAVCGVGAWPTSYAIMSETSALRLRAKSQAIGGVSAYISAIVCNFVLPYLYNPDAAHLGAKTGFVFTGLCLIGAVSMWILVPEMKGRTILEIDHMFEQKVRAIGSSKWKDETEEVRAGA